MLEVRLGKIYKHCFHVNLLLVSASHSYSLKTPKNSFSDFFSGGIQKGTLSSNVLNLRRFRVRVFCSQKLSPGSVPYGGVFRTEPCRISTREVFCKNS